MALHQGIIRQAHYTNGVKIMDNYHILLKFQDGETKTIDFKPLIGKGVSYLLLDKEYFGKASIDNGGGLEWTFARIF
jgi:hypothetical protein